MAFKSKAQRRKFAELLVTGKITPEAYERWNRETGRAELPERVKPKRKKKSTRKARRRTKTRAKAKSRPTRKRKSRVRRPK
jgi:hypothetical protein